jgi:hypothetical protein
MIGLFQQIKTVARGFRAINNFVAIAYLCMFKLKHLPQNPCGTPYPVEMTLPNIVAGGRFHTARHETNFCLYCDQMHLLDQRQ